MRMKPGLAALLLLLTACSEQDVAADNDPTSTPSDRTPTESTSSLPPLAQPGDALLEDGPVTPGRYRYDVFDLCAEVGCTAKPKPLPDVLVTVPAGWDAITTFNLIERDIPVGAGAPDGPDS